MLHIVSLFSSSFVSRTVTGTKPVLGQIWYHRIWSKKTLSSCGLSICVGECLWTFKQVDYTVYIYTSLGYIGDLYTFSFRHCSQDSENNETREKAGETVYQRHDESVPMFKKEF